MYLKQIEMQGFKSFADKIVLEFNSGITTVVGPNGSGKSNISDAIRWVLGEQSAKMLRGSKMEDIIFSGTEHRKPVGFSEVSIVIDNSDKKLPLEFSEVVVTRRVFRQGDSEYCINKSPCRLKDIHELFLDTGIGKDGYSIIGQGKIDEILSIKSEDRRNIFEEASGIMKYRVKKNEAERKLENTEQNLLRINDIINELESQIEPLREQSEKARNFFDLREELKVLEIGLYVENLKKYKENLSGFQDTYDSLKQEYDDKNKRLEDISTDNKSKLENSKELENKLNVLKDEYHNIETEIEKLNSEINLYSEKIKNAIENNERIDSEFVEQDEKTSTIEKEKSQKLKRLEYLNKQFIEFTDKLKLFEMQMEEHLSVLKESERSIEAMKQKVMDKMDLLSDKKVQASNISAHAENINKRKLVIDKEISSNILDIDRENMSLEDVNEFIAKTTIGLNKSRDDMKNYQFSESKIKSELSASLEKLSKTKILIQSKTSRLNLLRDMEKNFEGFNRTVKTILSSSDRIPGFNKGLHGVLARVINIERKYETAIEMALGAASQNIITDSEEDAKRTIDFLKQNNAGRATFLPISSVSAREIEDKILSKLKNMTGFIGIASDLVKFDAVYSNILLSLLGKVIIVDNMGNGIRVARELNHAFKIVTLDGDILNPGGSMTGGSQEQRASGIFSRAREILDIQNEINESSSKISNNENEIKELETQLGNIKDTIEKTYAIIRDFEHEKIRDEAKQKHIFDNIIRLNLHIEMVKQEKSQLTKKNEDAEKEIKKYEEEFNLINSEIVKCKLIIDEHTETFKDKQEDIDLLRDEITNHKISLGSITESIHSANEAIEKLELDKGNFEKILLRKKNEKDKNLAQIKNLQESCEGSQKNIEHLEEIKCGKLLNIDSINEQRDVVEKELIEIIDTINDINKNILVISEAMNKMEVRKTKLEVEIEAIQNKMWDEYEITFANAELMNVQIENNSKASRRVVIIKNEIKELGSVNINSINDYIKTKERYEFMSAQRNDMESAKSKLRKIIIEMMEIMKVKFIEQFVLINENFDFVFKELFGGGNARVKLVDEENVLESGIDIEVQLPGKKMQNLLLYSGGERALTAIALLFAILKLNPAPFCVLDEIEASLDDANVMRFASYVKNLSTKIQFVIVTHRKGTMEVSDTIYGVTMQEQGISKIISMELAKKAI